MTHNVDMRTFLDERIKLIVTVAVELIGGDDLVIVKGFSCLGDGGVGYFVSGVYFTILTVFEE